MSTIERRATIDAPVERVWSVLSDFGAISSWAPNVDHSCLLSDQTEGVGAVRRIQSERRTVVETIETWDPGAMLSYQITGLPPIIRSVTTTWRLEPAGESTNVVLVTEVDAGSRPPQQLIARVVGRRLATASEQMLDGLGRQTEQRLSPNDRETT